MKRINHDWPESKHGTRFPLIDWSRGEHAIRFWPRRLGACGNGLLPGKRDLHKEKARFAPLSFLPAVTLSGGSGSSLAVLRDVAATLTVTKRNDRRNLVSGAFAELLNKVWNRLPPDLCYTDVY